MKHRGDFVLMNHTLNHSLKNALKFTLSLSLIYSQVITAAPTTAKYRGLIKTDEFHKSLKKMNLKSMKTVKDLYKAFEKQLPKDVADQWHKVLAPSMDQPMPQVDVKSTFVDQEHVRDIKVMINSKGKLLNFHLYPSQGVFYKVANTEFTMEEMKKDGGYTQLHKLMSKKQLKEFDAYVENYGKPLSKEVLLKAQKNKKNLKPYFKALYDYFDAAEQVLKHKETKKTSWYDVNRWVHFLLPQAQAADDGDGLTSEQKTNYEEADTICQKDSGRNCVRKCKALLREQVQPPDACYPAVEQAREHCATRRHSSCDRLASTVERVETEKEVVEDKKERRAGLGWLPILGIAALIGVGLYFLLRKKKKKSAPPVVPPPVNLGKPGENEIVRDSEKDNESNNNNNGDGRPDAYTEAVP